MGHFGLPEIRVRRGDLHGGLAAAERPEYHKGRMRKLSLLFAALALPPALAAQADSTYPAPAAQDSQAAPKQEIGPVTVFTYTFSAPNEFVRANLQAGVTYEAELNSRGVTLTVRPRQSGIQRPDVRKDMMGPSASGSTTWRPTR